MQNRKIFKIIVILLSILFVISFGLSFINNNLFKNIFWIITILLTFSIVIDINSWSKIGLNVDLNESKIIMRSFNDNTVLLMVFYGTLLCLIGFFETLNHNIMNNEYIVIGMFIMTIEFELFTYLSIWNAKKSTAKLLK